MEEGKSIVERLSELEKQKQENQAHQSKKWNLPWKARMLGKKKKKDGWVILQHIGVNKAVWFEKVPIDEGVAMGKDMIPHVVSSEDVMLWKNKLPIIIVPDFSLRPIRAGELYSETLKSESAGSMGWQFIMNYIYKTQIKEKKKVAMGMIIVIALVVIGVGYYAFKSGAFS